ncbi:hypothetical protein HT031_000238 [Scenedesmus sp. PABB004]|nr:hypothetical protein HT031_000238 [Scenedesmus sp. PABB004]
MQGLQHRSSCCARAAPLAPARRVAAAAAGKGAGKGGKGFGAAKPAAGGAANPADGCPCGSGKSYKQCCKPLHAGSAAAPSVEATIRARFSAILKKDVSYLLKTTHPTFHAFQYGTEPGAALERLSDDLHNTVENYEYSALKVRNVEVNEDDSDEALALFQYAVYDLVKPLLDDQGQKARQVQIEKSRFLRDGAGDKLWRFADYQLATVPEAFARVAAAEQRDMAAAAAAAAQPGPGPAGGGGEAPAA